MMAHQLGGPAMIIKTLERVSGQMHVEQQSLKELIEHQKSIRVTDKDVDSVDRLIYNHSLKKGELQKLFGLSRVTFNSRIDEAEKEGLIGEPITNGKTKLYNRFDVAAFCEYMQFPKYKENYSSIAIAVQNHKGGTGKSTTTATLATATALDINLNARCLIIDLDPQGSTGQSLVRSQSDDSIYMTAIDMALANKEVGVFSQYLSAGYEQRDLILKAPFQTHLPNLDVIPAFPDDERFVDLFWQSDELEQQKLLTKLREIMNVYKDEYDFIFIDTPPQNSPILWAVNEASDAILIPVTPREYDFASTTNYLKTLSGTLGELPSKGENIKWLKMLPVNFNDKSNSEVRVFDKLLRTAGSILLSTAIEHSEAFVATAELNRTVLDIVKSEDVCSAKQLDKALLSVSAVYKQITNELKLISNKAV